MNAPVYSVRVVVHGGAGASRDHVDGCVQAAGAGRSALLRDGDVLAAAIAAVTVLEDDPRFNAGTGSVLRMDGHTVEMDAAVMDTHGRLGAVACLRRVRNPVQVAEAVSRTPHWLLCGEGADRFARNAGFALYDCVTDQARSRHAALMAQLRTDTEVRHGVSNPAFLRLWNYPDAPPAGSHACDTVGAVVRGADGHFAVAASTGGAAPSLLGRVGDTPIVGAGFYAGPAGAVAVTGIGEHIVRHLLAHRVYQWLAGGTPLQQALDQGVGLFDREIDVGLIAVTATDSGAASNRDMPWAQA
ncbi:isoaspartyl peptidase/L-asparaginase [Oxalobacteraceae bacterium A2-2]